MIKAGSVTDQRKRSIEILMQEAGISEAFVFLCDKDRALLSYLISVDQTLDEKLHGRRVTVTRQKKSIEGIFVATEADSRAIKSILVELDRDARDYQVIPLYSVSDTSYADTTGYLGYVLAKGEFSLERPRHRLAIELFALSVFSSRNARVLEAVSQTQKLFTNPDRDYAVDGVIQASGILIRDVIGARRCFYQNRNKFDKWIDITTHDEIDDLGIEWVEGSNEHEISRGRVRLENEGQTTTHEAISVPLPEPAYRLENIAFSDSADFIDTLSACEGQISTLLFIDKVNPGYLQSSFSETDLRVAQRVFGYIDQFAASKVFNINYLSILRFLKQHSTAEGIDSKTILELLKKLSVAFTNVFVLTAEYEDNEIEIELDAASRESALSEDYYVRLKRNYLQKYFSNPEEVLNEHVQIGLDITLKGYDFEFHCPNTEGRSRIYVIRFERNVMTESVLRCLIHFFNELQVRLRKLDYDIGRSSYLMEARHAVIHHFSAANKWLTHMRPGWEAGARSPFQWQELRKNELFRKSIKGAHWSLAQARIILENGRFLLSEIDPAELNRKPFNIRKAVQDAFMILDNVRDQKSIIIKSRILGSPPAIMNADDALMRIAILNLVDNALKYSRYHKTVFWQISHGAEGYEFSITNRGTPIDPDRFELLKRVGVRGRQQDHMNMRPGTGLGIPVVVKILRAHAPDVELEFDPLKNLEHVDQPANTFYFRMPYLTGQSGDNRH